MNRSDHSKEHKYNTINNKIIWIYKMYENQSIIYLFDHQLVFLFFSFIPKQTINVLMHVWFLITNQNEWCRCRCRCDAMQMRVHVLYQSRCEYTYCTNQSAFRCSCYCYCFALSFTLINQTNDVWYESIHIHIHIHCTVAALFDPCPCSIV